VREAALDALERRWASAEREELTVAKQPARTVLGAYTTARKSKANGPRRERRPYTTLLTSLAPLVASCDCPDFVRGGLGVCKHILVVLAHIHGSARRLTAARNEKAAAASRLDWDPRLPLRGELDRVAGLRFSDVPPVWRVWFGRAPSSSPRVGIPTGGATCSLLHRRWKRRPPRAPSSVKSSNASSVR
jgi:hypothetical protein